jgi:hypothetical protein
MNYEEATAQLETLGPRPDLDTLDSTASALEEGLRTGDPHDYLRFVVELCDRLNSYDLGDWPRQDRLVRRYSELALRTIQPQPLDIELHLLEHALAAVPPPETDPADWPALRRASAARWLDALARLEQEVDDTFDPADLPALNIAPAGTGLPAGVAPEVVQDPRLRQEYEQAIARNTEYILRYGRQTELRRLRERYLPVAERYVVTSYARPPERPEELRELLDQYIAQPARRDALLAAVARERSGGTA